MLKVARVLAIMVVVAALAACADRAPGPTGLGITATRSGVPFAVGLASPAWQTTAGNSAKKASLPGVSPVRVAMNALQAGHAYALVGVAQYLAVQRADMAVPSSGRSQLEAERGAVAGASAAVLTYLFPADAQEFADQVAAQANDATGEPHPWFTRGAAIGREVGAAIVARAQVDGFNTPFTGTIPVDPTNPGLWISNTVPPTTAGGSLPTSTPWFLASASQFRPGPPPAWGSAAFNAALTEVHTISNSRTLEQEGIAVAWAGNAGTVTPPGFWLQFGTKAITAHGLSERAATHLYALLSATMYDALIGCWDAKQTYWLIRPWQTDVGVATLAAVGKPNHPSYPSGHSCVSASAAEVLSTFFPEDRDRFDAMVIEAGLTRIWTGIHYQFDISAGQTLGRDVAHLTIAADASGKSVLTPH